MLEISPISKKKLENFYHNLHIYNCALLCGFFDELPTNIFLRKLLHTKDLRRIRLLSTLNLFLYSQIHKYDPSYSNECLFHDISDHPTDGKIYHNFYIYKADHQCEVECEL